MNCCFTDAIWTSTILWWPLEKKTLPRYPAERVLNVHNERTDAVTRHTKMKITVNFSTFSIINSVSYLLVMRLNVSALWCDNIGRFNKNQCTVAYISHETFRGRLCNILTMKRITVNKQRFAMNFSFSVIVSHNKTLEIKTLYNDIDWNDNLSCNLLDGIVLRYTYSIDIRFLRFSLWRLFISYVER